MRGERLLLAVLLCFPLAGFAGEAEPPKEQPKEQPKEEEKPANPFGDVKSQRADALPGKIVLSDGKELKGKLFLTRDKPIELFDTGRQEWNKLFLKDLSRLDIAVEKEEKVKEWRWKENGSDVKVDTGRTKLDRVYKCAATGPDGKKIEGHLRGTVIYVKESEDKDAKRFFLLWNSPGDFDQKPEDLIYVKAVVLGEEAAKGPAEAAGLSPAQLKVVTPVVESLAAKLAAMAGKYPELTGLDAKAMTRGADGIAVVHSRNYTPPNTKRAVRTEDFGEHGVFLQFLVCPRAGRDAESRPATASPAREFERLGIDLWCTLQTGANPSKGFVEEARTLLDEHAKQLQQADEVGAKVSLILVDGGERKIAVIKAVREITGLGLKEAKALVDGAPKAVKTGLTRAEAEELQKKLEAAGAKVKIE